MTAAPIPAGSGHTVGSWRVDPSYPCDIQSADGKLEIASVAASVLSGGDVPEHLSERHANARLIATAPDLLEVLLKARTVLALILIAESKGAYDSDTIAQHPVIAEIDAVIARATGGAF